MPWPHVQFQPQMGLRGGLDFVWPISQLTLPHRAISKVHERRSGQDKSPTAFNPCCFLHNKNWAVQVNWSADPAQSEKFKPDPNEVTRWWHFLGKAGSAPPTNIDLCSRFGIYPLCNSWGTLDPDFCIFCRHYRSSTLNFSFLRRL